MACHLLGVEPLSEPIITLTYSQHGQLHRLAKNFGEISSKTQNTAEETAREKISAKMLVIPLKP